MSAPPPLPPRSSWGWGGGEGWKPAARFPASLSPLEGLSHLSGPGESPNQAVLMLEGPWTVWFRMMGSGCRGVGMLRGWEGAGAGPAF